MGLLRDARAGRLLFLPAQCLVGRASASYLRLDDERVSSAHALVCWTGAHWEVRDLGSRNGTLLNDEPLSTGEGRALGRGDAIAFGSSAQTWLLHDDAPPTVGAREVGTDRWLVARDGALRLPGPSEHPRLVRDQVPPHVWLFEAEDELRLLADGDIVQKDGRVWRIHLPAEAAGTRESDERALRLAELEWHFRVSGDEEFVALRLETPRGAIEQGARAHHYLLLTLARIRQQGERDGWVYADELATMLGTDETHLNVLIFRARKAIADLKVVDAAETIERRRATRELRAGFDRVVIQRA